MKVIVLSSGSKGNTTFVETDNTKILIDCGNTCKYICQKLLSINVKPKDIDAILISHTHVDHIKGLQVFLHKFNTKVYMTQKMQPELSYIENYKFINSNNFNIKDITIDIIKTSHDASDSHGFILTNNNSSMVYVTDTGYINVKYHEILKNRNVYILESNHDVDLLNNGPYPFNLRQRILGDKGHLSNYDCAKYLAEFIGNNTKYIILAHLSEENNTKELAYNTLKERLNENYQKVDKIIIAAQNEETEMIEI